MRKKLLRLVRIAPLALLFAGSAFAQTTGTLLGVVTDASTGKPVPGAVVIARSPNLQGEQTVVTDANGSYRITLLPPGEYTLAVQLEGYKPAERSDLYIRPDKTIRANLAVVPEAVRMEEQVVRTGTAPAVNIGSAESGAVISREFVANVPVGRTVQDLTVSVPTVSSDFFGVGFAGAQSAENAYVLDGLNVTNPAYGTLGGGNPAVVQLAAPSLLTNFIQEVDVKTGGFQPEYGRTTGGVLNMVTRSGSNEFHGSVFGNFTPRMWVQPTGQTTGAAGEAVAYRSKPSEGAYDLDLGFEAGGPIMKDKLWFYAGFAPVITRRTTERWLRSNVLTTDPGASCDEGFSSIDPYGRCIDSGGNFVQNRIPGTASTVRTGRTTYQIIGKLTYLLDENNNFTVSAFGMPSSTSNYNMNYDVGSRIEHYDEDTLDVIGRYAGKYLDKKLILEAVAGYHRDTQTPKPTAYEKNTNSIRFREDMNLGLLDPTVFDACGGATADPGRCTVLNYWLGGMDFMTKTTSERLAGRVSGSYLAEIAGSHNTKVGLDVERNTYRILKDYSGPDGRLSAYPTILGAPRLASNRIYGHVTDPNAVDGFSSTPDGWVSYEPETQSVSTSTALFAQDSWQLPVANVTLNYGIRWEAQRMENNDNPDANGFDIKNNWAPRVQAIWDFTGNGRGKLAGNWGRFFYSIPLDMGDRSFGAEQTMNFRINNTCSGFASAFTGANPTGVQAFNPASATSANCGLVARTTGGPFSPWYVNTTGVFATPVAPDIQGVYVDQFGGQLEYEILPDLSLGFEYNGRRQGQAIEDMSSDDGNNYYIGNPGYSKPFTIGDVTYNSKTVTTFDDATGREVQVPFPKPQRSYDGFTVFARKNFSKGWIAQAAYTYSKLRGNLPGVFRPETNQLDPGITSEYDLASLMANRYGLLPGDQTHAIKLYGAYTFAFSPRFNATAGAAYTGTSGNPVSALGSHPLYGDYEAFILPRGMAGRTDWLNRVDLRGALEYVIRPPYALKFSVELFNIFNSQDITTADESYTFDTIQPVAHINCTSSAPQAKVPWQRLQQDCPDLKYLKTIDGRSILVNKNWGRALPGTTSYQVPISMRLGVALSF